MVAGVLASWTSIQERENEFYAWLLLLGTAMFGVFLAFDIILFYVFFELTLVPLFFLIGIWGGPERRHAARKFFIYTLAGSLITLLGVLAVVFVTYHMTGGHRLTFSIPELVEKVAELQRKPDPTGFWPVFQFWVFLALIAGFAIKVPLFPVHTWLPLAHVEAPNCRQRPPGGSAAKDRRLRFPAAMPAAGAGRLHQCWGTANRHLVGHRHHLRRPLLVGPGRHEKVGGLFQRQPPWLLHVGHVRIERSRSDRQSCCKWSTTGLSTGALFLLVGMLYERYHTRKLSDYGGMGAKLGVMCFCMCSSV